MLALRLLAHAAKERLRPASERRLAPRNREPQPAIYGMPSTRVDVSA